MTLNCLARAGSDKDLEAIGTTKHEQGKTGQLFVSVRPFLVLDEAMRAVTFEGAGISRIGTVQKGLGDRRLSDHPMLKCSLSDPASDSFLSPSVGSCVTACSTLTLLPLPCCRFSLLWACRRAKLLWLMTPFLSLFLFWWRRKRGRKCTHADKCVKRDSALTFSSPLLLMHVFEQEQLDLWSRSLFTALVTAHSTSFPHPN